MKREREKKITRLHLILLALLIIAVVITIIVIKANDSKKLEKYKKLEKDLATATFYYLGDKVYDIGKGESMTVSMKKIIDGGYLQDSLTSECTGYTKISNYRNLDGDYVIGYNTYIKCGNKYQTDNYSDDEIN